MMNNTNQDSPKTEPDENSQPEKEETIAQRSARLEAEAAAMAARDAAEHYARDEDPLSPSTIHDEEDEFTTETGDEADTGYDGDTLSPEQSKAVITALQNEIDTIKEQAARALAEAENTRRRAKKEREDAGKFAISSFAKDILEIADTLRRAVDSAPTETAENDPQIKAFIEGVEATERVLLKNIEKHGIQKIEPLDEPFNPNFHEVMFEAPVPGKPAGIVMQVLEAGYILNDRLLRAAKVGVTKDDGSTPKAPPSGGHVDTSA